MTWKEMKKRIDAFKFEARTQYINEHCKHKMYEVIKHTAYQGKKKLFDEHLVLSNVSFDVNGNFKGYFFHTITPTGRVGKDCIFFTNDDSISYWANGKKYRETITMYCPTLDEYLKKVTK